MLRMCNAQPQQTVLCHPHEASARHILVQECLAVEMIVISAVPSQPLLDIHNGPLGYRLGSLGVRDAHTSRSVGRHWHRFVRRNVFYSHLKVLLWFPGSFVIVSPEIPVALLWCSGSFVMVPGGFLMVSRKLQYGVPEASVWCPGSFVMVPGSVG